MLSNQHTASIRVIPYEAPDKHVGAAPYVHAVEDDLGLRFLGRPLEFEILDPSFMKQSIEQVLSIVVDITKNDPLVPLTVSQSQLLERNLILLRLANGIGDAILVCRLVDCEFRPLLPGR